MYRLRLKRIAFFQNKLDRWEYEESRKMNSYEREFADHLSFFKPKVVKPEGQLLVQMTENYEFVTKFAGATKVLAEKHDLEVVFYDTHINKSLGLTSELEDNYCQNNTTPREKIHAAFGGKVVFSNDDKFHDQEFIKKEIKHLLETYSDPDKFVELTIDNVLIGDLVYDTCLRFYERTTFDEITDELIHMLEIAVNIYYNFKLFLKENKVKMLLNSYVGYVQHAITVRVCLAEGIPVQSIASDFYVLQEINNDFPWHVYNHTLFSKDKEIKPQYLEAAKDQLNKRFSGVNDAATTYMRQSAYGDDTVSPELQQLFSKTKRNVVLFAHEFTDCPHINRALLFRDLYQHFKETVLALKDQKDTTLFVKVHPGGTKQSKDAIFQFIESLDAENVEILPLEVNNSQLIKLKPDMIASYRGSVGLEMAYFGIPAILLYDNYYTEFDFVHTCKSVEEYFAILKGEKEFEVTFDKNQLYSFYAQAFIEPGELDSENLFARLKFGSLSTASDEYLEKLNSSDFWDFKKKWLNLYEDTVASQR